MLFMRKERQRGEDDGDANMQRQKREETRMQNMMHWEILCYT